MLEMTTPNGVIAGEFPTLDLPGYEAPATDAVIESAQALVGKLVGHSVSAYDVEDLENLDVPVKLGIQNALLMGALAIEPTGTYKPVDASAVVSDGEPVENLVELAQLGYSRFKIKVSPKTDPAWLASVAAQFPELQIDIDANGSFAPADLPAALKLLRTGVTVFEQPFEHEMSTSPEAQQLFAALEENQFISLDESATDIEFVLQAHKAGAINAVCVKPFRYGGITATLEIAELLCDTGISIQLGGLLEAGAGRRLLALVQNELNLALIGDISPASYLYQDQPFDDLVLVDGKLHLN